MEGGVEGGGSVEIIIATMSKSCHLLVIQLIDNHTIIKMEKRICWNNKNMASQEVETAVRTVYSRPPRCTVQQDTNMSDTTYNSDSGFSSRSPTPIKLQQGDQSNLEENFSLSPTLRRVYHEVYSNTNLPHYSNSTSSNGYQTPPPVPPHPPPPITSAQQFYHHVPPPPAPIFYGYPIYGQQQQQAPQQPRRSDGHDQSVYTGGGNNNHNKRRYQSGRFSPPMLYKYGLPTPYLNGLHYGSPYKVGPYCSRSRNRLQEMKEPPKELLTGGEWDNLSRGIWKKFTDNQQSNETFKKKMMLWRSLLFIVKSAYPRYGLYLVGSTISGFGSDNSDVDMCLLVRHTEMDQRSEAVGHLEELLMCLRRCDFVTQPELIQAKVPILKFRDHRRGLDVDLNCNNSVGIRNTHLLHCYAQLDWRVRPLVLVVKLWAHRHNINDAKNMTISSYSLVLMDDMARRYQPAQVSGPCAAPYGDQDQPLVVDPLDKMYRSGVSPAVLPCLHDMYQGKFSPQSDVQHIDVHEVIPIFQSENKQTLGELLLAFLRYFVEFDFSQYALSVRLAARIPIEECRRARAYKNDPHQWKYLCIEEPFDLTNTARSVYDRDVFESVKETADGLVIASFWFVEFLKCVEWVNNSSAHAMPNDNETSHNMYAVIK
ncbi:unnamed protein product, partial [Timema podura]|nr:unnamed protein product [Timema podura]